MITKQTIADVFERSKGRCENPKCGLALTFSYENHHIYWRSQYKGQDRDQSWNLAAICHRCHYSIHSQANRELDSYLKKVADSRRPEYLRDTRTSSDLLNKRKQRRTEYRKKIEAFKQSHNGLSPYQIQYRQMKERNARLSS